jgi:hypothetical protein
MFNLVNVKESLIAIVLLSLLAGRGHSQIVRDNAKLLKNWSPKGGRQRFL